VQSTLVFISKTIFNQISIPLNFSISTREFERAFGKSNQKIKLVLILLYYTDEHLE